MKNIQIPDHIVKLQAQQAQIVKDLKAANDKVAQLKKELQAIQEQLLKEINIL